MRKTKQNEDKKRLNQIRRNNNDLEEHALKLLKELVVVKEISKIFETINMKELDEQVRQHVFTYSKLRAQNLS